MRVRVCATSSATKKARNGQEYTGIKLENGSWVNVMADLLGFKGREIDITEPKTLGEGKQLWAFLENKKSGETKEASPRTAGNKTFAEWALLVRDANRIATEVLPDDAQAQASLINTLVIAWARGDVEHTGDEDPPF